MADLGTVTAGGPIGRHGQPTRPLATAARASNGAVILVSHDAVNSALLAFLDPQRWPEASAVCQPTECLDILYRDGGVWTVAVAGFSPSPPLRQPPGT
jgi:broad specificity phosphatase PhoE